MKKPDLSTFRSKTSVIRLWTIISALLVICFISGSWIFISLTARKQAGPATNNSISRQDTTDDVYTAYKDTVYKLSRKDGSPLWKVALKQAYKPNRIIGSYLQLKVTENVVYVALEYGVYALKASSGEEIWHYAPTITSAELAQDHGRIGQMFVDKSMIYLELTYGQVVGIDRSNGSLQWNNLSFPNGGDFSASDDTLYVSEFSSVAQVPILHAIDGRTGKERWQLKRQLLNTSLSFTFVSGGIVYSGGNPLYALDARTGKELWEKRLPQSGPYFTSLQLQKGVIYANTGTAIAFSSGQNFPLDAFRVYALDAQTGKQLWESQAGYALRNELIDGGQSVLLETVAPQAYKLQALDARTGTQRWQIASGDLACANGDACQPWISVANNSLYVLSDKQPYTLQVFDTHTGKPLQQLPLAIPAKQDLNLSVPGNNVLYIRASMHEGDPYSSGSNTSFTHYFVYAISLENGATDWKYDIGSLLDVQVPITELLLAP